MAAASETNQTIARLTPLAELLAMIDAHVGPVAPRSAELAAAARRILATDLTAPTRPDAALALLDGWALTADATLGAGVYSPALLPAIPQRVDVGQPMPLDTDCVAPLDAVTVRGGCAQSLGTINPGDGVLPAGGDCGAKTALRNAGEPLRAIDIAALAAAGLVSGLVREPRICVQPLHASNIVDAAAWLVANDIDRRGGVARLNDSRDNLEATLAADDTDAVVAIGGTGQGRSDASVQTLARAGRLAAHGIALTPGETAAFGFCGPRPVLLLPGRLDAALSVWLVVGRRLLARLAGDTSINIESEPAETLPLARKVSSTVGLVEMVPVRRVGGQAVPLATKYLPLSSLARSDGWILVPADSEGYSAGSPVQVRPWP
jgi:molybdopterin biosynthesis enzyme